MLLFRKIICMFLIIFSLFSSVELLYAQSFILSVTLHQLEASTFYFQATTHSIVVSKSYILKIAFESLPDTKLKECFISQTVLNDDCGTNCTSTLTFQTWSTTQSSSKTHKENQVYLALK